ncbi:type IV secretion system protein [Vulcaniibacterium thermophilum]|jgi:type IV secretion system protein VirB6|uniref:Type IV secretion system protein VirB6 n=1 Tax=Vulcaniibacterium thermophilum TaxID=1169913 RepID=A0A918Z3F4_9GAMM|nr:type IV secretion system protein [Vulcaniibacterium thermophilum]GHE35305.1 hypothetical protein GCM10007167_16940 [Vulcaniibacterium thermophilum]
MEQNLLASLGGLSSMLPAKAGLLSDASQLMFFHELVSFISDELKEFQENLLARTMTWVGGVALSAMTLWIMIQGYRIVSGQSRDSMMQFVTHSLRAMLIVTAATTFSIAGNSISEYLTEGLKEEIAEVVSGDDDDTEKKIDRSLGYMQLALSSIDSLHTGGSEAVQQEKDRNMWFTGIGIAGPAITGGALLLLNKIAMALVVGLGPFFVLCLLFEQTKQLFHRWLWYAVGTLFSLAVLSVMVTIALDAVLAVSIMFWTGKFLGANPEGINSLALQQGGLGLILTVLIITAPPMAASFFQGTLGQFTPYSQFGSANGSVGSRPGEPNFRGYSATGAHAVDRGEVRPSERILMPAAGLRPGAEDTVKPPPASTPLTGRERG